MAKRPTTRAENDQCDQQSGVEATCAGYSREVKAVGDRGRLRIDVRWLLQRPAYQIRHGVKRNKVQQKGADDFEHAEAGAKHRGDARPCASSGRTGQHRAGEGDDTTSWQCEGNRGRSRGARQQLPLRTNVEHAGAEGNGDCATREHERNRTHQCRGRERVPRTHRPAPQCDERAPNGKPPRQQERQRCRDKRGNADKGQ